MIEPELATRIENNFLKLFEWSNDTDLYYYLAQSPFISLEDILQTPHKPWYFRAVSRNVNIRGEMIMNNLDKNWDFDFLSRNPTFTFDVIIKLLHEWNWTYISMNPNIFINHVLEHPECPWNFETLIDNVNITIEIILANPQLPWHYRALSMSSKVNMEIVNQNRHLPWCFASLSANENLRFTDVLDYPNEKWDWSCLSATLPDLIIDKKYPIDFYYLSRNPNNYKIYYLLKCYPNKDFDKYHIALNNPNINSFADDNFKQTHKNQIARNHHYSIELLLRDRSIYDWGIISERSDITTEIVKRNRDLNWSIQKLMKNPNINVFELFSLEDKPNNKSIFKLFPEFAKTDPKKIHLNNRNELKAISENKFHLHDYCERFFLKLSEASPR